MKKLSRNKKFQLDLEIQLYERILAEKPLYLEALKALAHAYTERGDYEKGLALDLRLSTLYPQDALIFYNLSCSYALLGRIEEGLSALENALQLGYDDRQWLEQDPDLENIRKEPRFAQLIAAMNP